MFIFYIDGKKYTVDVNRVFDKDIIQKKKLTLYYSSPDENTPAWENTLKGSKFWMKKGYILHRLTGPAVIRPNGTMEFWIDNKYYGKNIHDWLKDHPNQDNTFQIEMLLKYT
jgi:hypothetical protein